MPAQAPGGEVPFQILRMANAVIRDLVPLFAPFGLTPQQAAVLFRIESLDEAPTLAGLARALSVSKQNVTGMVARLVEAGLIRREGDPDDLRASRLGITADGNALIAKIRPSVRRWSIARLAALDPRLRGAFERALGELLASFE